MADIETASFAIAGNGEVDEGNAAALLDDYLPQKIGAVYRPERIPRSNAPLSAVVDFLESPDILGPKGTVPSADLVADLLKRRSDEGDARVELIYLWPAEPTEEDKALVIAARDAGIRVVSITDAIDDLLWEPEKPAAEEPAAEPVAEQAAVAETTEKVMQHIDGDFGATISALLADFIRQIVREELNAAATASGDKPPFEGPYKPAGTLFQAAPAAPAADTDDGTEKFAFYVNSDGRYRKAKTRPRKDETRVNLTQAEIDDLGQRGLIDEK